MENKRKRLLELLLVFLKIGVFAFGGGYAMIPLIQKETVEKKKWVSPEDIVDIVAIAESTPGPIAISASTFVGYRIAGVAGATLATIGVIVPSFIIIFVLSFVLRQFESITAVKYAFFGIRAGVLALIVNALISVYKQCPKKIISYIIMLGAFVAVAFLGINVLLVIAVCAVVGLIYYLAAMRMVRKEDEGK
ncbi:MAG: chromate transporter [Clostridia bacterium]|nr:chromate transporter [Clostridia bacterium]MDY3784466.1 chromate transporter [Eubacteriales bacterium]